MQVNYHILKVKKFGKNLKQLLKKFNAAKNVFYKEEKSTQQDNLENKIALIEIAESLKDSEDWEMQQMP